jgi:hypothetical protein
VVYAERVTVDRATRAEPFAAQARAGNVKLVAGRRNGEYLGEVAKFPSGRLKDLVDASSGAFNKLASPPAPGRPAVGGVLPALAGARDGVYRPSARGAAPGRWSGEERTYLMNADRFRGYRR